MLFIVEIIMLGSGIWALVTGKLPSFVFGKKYRIEGVGARIIGVILMTPLPLTLIVSFMLGVFMGEDAVPFAVGFELFMLFICFLAAFLISRKVRQPI